jgi:hypothetical protein
MNGWVVCRQGKGYLLKDSVQEKLQTNFDKDAVGIIREDRGENILVWLIGTDACWIVPKTDAEEIDVTKTGDKFDFRFVMFAIA